MIFFFIIAKFLRKRFLNIKICVCCLSLFHQKGFLLQKLVPRQVKKFLPLLVSANRISPNSTNKQCSVNSTIKNPSAVGRNPRVDTGEAFVRAQHAVWDNSDLIPAIVLLILTHQRSARIPLQTKGKIFNVKTFSPLLFCTQSSSLVFFT